MKALIIASIISIVSATAMAQDLTLPGAKWIAKHTDYKCAAFGGSVNPPAAHAKFKVVFENLVTDSSLDNGLLTATYTDKGMVCRYSAIVFADNAASTMRLVQSKAVALKKRRGDDCLDGKVLLDRSLESNNYLYWGHPHNLTIMMRVPGAQASCGNDFIGLNFVVAGKLAPAPARFR